MQPNRSFLRYTGVIKLNDMSKTLKVISPFFVLEEGDTLELAKDGKSYVSEYSAEDNTFDEDKQFSSSYKSSYTISKDLADSLVAKGFLKEDVEDKNGEDFVNVFDEIDNLLGRYGNDVKNVDKALPAALQLEQTTVLTNMIKLLNHLKSLKK